MFSSQQDLFKVEHFKFRSGKFVTWATRGLHGHLAYVNECDMVSFRWGVGILFNLDNDMLEEIKITRRYKFRSSPQFTYFRHFIGSLYEMRVKAKAEFNEPMQLLVKNILNAAYGKFGQKIYDEIFIHKGENLDEIIE